MLSTIAFAAIFLTVNFASAYRLPETLKPVHYDLTISPDFDTFTFTGIEEIEIYCLNETNNIIIHIDDITVDEYAVFDIDGNHLQSNLFVEDPEKQFYIIVLTENLTPSSTYFLNINYTGVINNLNKGFYRSSYIDYETNQTRWLASTQMQATEARRAFPCFDEPQLKAQFSIKLYRPPNYNSNSNMRLVQSIVEGDRVLDVFETSPPISTYIVAFIISDFEITRRGKYAVYGRPDQIRSGNGEYALTVGEACIEELENFVNIPYSLDKLDQIGMPNRFFDLGGMENWGMVVYKERVLLYNDSVTTTDEKQRLATIISHEFTHQWFGDLVTPVWFSYVWLNEGFATYFELHTMHNIEPSWRLMEQFVTFIMQKAMQLDSLESTRPMTFDAETPDEINALYDNVAYEKSGSVIKMMEHFLSNEVYRNGLTLHLLKSQYANADSDDLWESLQTSLDNNVQISLPLNFTVKSIMTTWEHQAGYPVVNVQRNYNTGEIELSQEKFLLKNSTPNSTSIWIIPVNYASENNANFEVTLPDLWLYEKSQTFSTAVTANEWIILNKQVTGYYRVNYDANNWQLLTNTLLSDNMKQISPVNRAQLLDDAFNLARSGRLEYNIALNLSSYLINEDDYIPLYSAVNAFNFLNSMLSNSNDYNQFKSYITQILDLTYLKYGLEVNVDEEHTEKLTRIYVFPILCALGHTNCLNDVSEIFYNWKNNGIDFHQDIQNIVYCNEIRQGNLNDWEYMLELYKITREDTTRLRILNSLGCSNNEITMLNFLDIITNSDTPINDFEKLQAIQAVYNSGNVGVEVVIYYLSHFFDNIKHAFTTSQIGTILRNVGGKLNSEQQLNMFTTMVTTNIEEDLLNAANSAILDAEANLKWIAENEPVIADWLNTVYSNQNVI